MRYSIVLNRQLDVGVQLNALGHVAVGLAHIAPHPNQAMRSFKDASGSFVGFMSDHPLIVLGGANSSKLRQAYQAVREAGLACNAFVLDMKDGEPVDQERAVRAKMADELMFVAVGAWGGPEPVRQVFRRFSLYR